jgi:Ca2+-transporting ATPase
MSPAPTQPPSFTGLSSQEAVILLQQHGKNLLSGRRRSRFVNFLMGLAKEPVLILLGIACLLYFLLGSVSEGLMMITAIVMVGAISVYQEVKSSRALHALQQLTEPKVKVIRDNAEVLLPVEQLVPGDIILLEEGMKIPADAIVLQQNDLSVNEAIITGESFPVAKSGTDQHQLYQGTTINTGQCVAKVTATGNHTTLGKLAKSVGDYEFPKTLLQQQINRFVRSLALFGIAGLLIVFLINYWHLQDWATSLLFALTLALSAIPEEIPVAVSSFMALGAYKLSKMGVISRQPQVIENLGAVSVICFDKTGTLTENRMELKYIYDHKSRSMAGIEQAAAGHENVLYYAVLASETNPFDAMEKGIVQAYTTNGRQSPGAAFEMIHEYPLHGYPPMMTHIYKTPQGMIAAAKGAAERIMRICKLTEEEYKIVSAHIADLASKGFRLLGVASASPSSQLFPESQDDFDWRFEGLVALYDPPRENIPGIIKQFRDAKIEVKIITGDYPETAMHLAGEIGIQHPDHHTTGNEVMDMSETELMTALRTTNVFGRMFPEAKLKVIEALKKDGQIVAMTGDGVNDGPALKASSVGIAMGKKGTELARQASDLILTDDNIEKMVSAVREGRKIYANLKKAIRYIISIHIPIILVAALPVILGWKYPNIFTPIHVIFMELIMGPTCSIFFEKEPVESNSMLLPPRKRDISLFSREELLISVTQGCIIAAATLMLYYFYVEAGSSLEETRTMVFTTLLSSNIFLTFVNRSFTENIFYTIRYKNPLAPVIVIISVFFLACLHFIPAVRDLFGLVPITAGQFLLCVAIAFGSVIWFEVYKTGLVKPVR